MSTIQSLTPTTSGLEAWRGDSGAGARQHVIERGETLLAIVQRFGTDVAGCSRPTRRSIIRT